MFDQAVDATAARSAAQAGAQLGQVGLCAGRYHFHLALFGVAHPAAQVELAGLAVYIPPEAHPLHTALNQKMKNHRWQPSPVLQIGSPRATWQPAPVPRPMDFIYTGEHGLRPR